MSISKCCVFLCDGTEAFDSTHKIVIIHVLKKKKRFKNYASFNQLYILVGNRERHLMLMSVMNITPAIESIDKDF